MDKVDVDVDVDDGWMDGWMDVMVRLGEVSWVNCFSSIKKNTVLDN